MICLPADSIYAGVYIGLAIAFAIVAAGFLIDWFRR